MAEKTSWALATFLCVILPVALDYYDLALAVASGLGDTVVEGEKDITDRFDRVKQR